MKAGTYIIAEAGVNHDGDVARARALIDIAVAAGADAVKFQLFDPAALVTASAPTAQYQSQNLADDKISQQAMLQKLTLPQNAFAELSDYCATKNIDFLCTPFDAASLAYLVQHTKMPFLKLASGEVTNGPFLHAAAQTGMNIILSTGMANLEEIGIALSIMHAGYAGVAPTLAQPTAAMLKALVGRVTILHCVSQYPAPMESMNLRAMGSIAEAFKLPVGLSDHSTGTPMAIAAAARGAVMIEKHFTYDKAASGPDHAASLTPSELNEMVAGIRAIEVGLGSPIKECVAAEMNTREVARRSLVATRPIAKGERFSPENLGAKRPSTGPVSPNHYWQMLDKPAQRAYQADDFIAAQELDAD